MKTNVESKRKIKTVKRLSRIAQRGVEINLTTKVKPSGKVYSRKGKKKFKGK